MEKLDINGHSQYWEKHKKNNYSLMNFNKHNAELTKQFLKDFEEGINTPKGNKGRRKPATLLKLRGICVFLNNHFGKKNFEHITKRELHSLFDKMAKGDIMKTKVKTYRGVGDFIKNIKTLWGWMIRTGKVKKDVTEDLSKTDYSNGKPAWVFLTHEQMKKLIDTARGDYRALILFLYDSGIRPQEAYRIYVSDFNKDFTELTIPEYRENGDKVSKTFERTIRLKHSSQLIKNYVEDNNLRQSDLLILKSQPTFNKYLRELSKKLFGTGKTKARATYDKLKLYDIRHLAGIYWLDRYKRNQDLMYRMGWTTEKMINYYTEFLGRRDKIDDEDMLTKEDVNRYEKDIAQLKKAVEYLALSHQEKPIKKKLNQKEYYVYENLTQVINLLKNP